MLSRPAIAGGGDAAVTGVVTEAAGTLGFATGAAAAVTGLGTGDVAAAAGFVTGSVALEGADREAALGVTCAVPLAGDWDGFGGPATGTTAGAVCLTRSCTLPS